MPILHDSLVDLAAEARSAARPRADVDRLAGYWARGAAVVETCLATATGDHADAPFPLDETQAALWHRAQAEAYRHAIEMMAPPCEEGLTPTAQAA